MSLYERGNDRARIRTVLLADDDPEDRAIFEDALKQCDPAIELRTVKNGDELVALLLLYVPDVLFLDLDMPCRDGLQCLVQIRATVSGARLPVVIFSSNTLQANIHNAYELGAHLFFVKPSRYVGMIHSLNRILHLDWSQPESIRKEYFRNGRYVAMAGEED